MEASVSIANIQSHCKYFNFNFIKGGEDECSIAANIYQCGRENAPDATNAMQAAAASNVASVSFQRDPAYQIFLKMILLNV